LRCSLALTSPAFRPGPKGPAVLKEPVGSSVKVVIWIVRSPGLLDDSVEDGENVSVGVAMFGLKQSVSGSVIVLVVAVYVVVPPRGPVSSHPIMESNESSTHGGACACIDVKVTVFEPTLRRSIDLHMRGPVDVEARDAWKARCQGGELGER
jgi:hypothetical protein